MRVVLKPAFLLVFLFLSTACNPFDNFCPIMGDPAPDSTCGKAIKKKYGSYEPRNDVVPSEEFISRPTGDFSVSRGKSNGDAACDNDELDYSKSEKTLKGELCGESIDKTYSEDDIEKIEARLDEAKTMRELFAALEEFAKE